MAKKIVLTSEHEQRHEMLNKAIEQGVITQEKADISSRCMGRWTN